MHKIWIVLRNELVTTFKRTAYLVFAFIIPLLAVLILAGVKIVQGRSAAGSAIPGEGPSENHMEAEGYVDQSGLIRVLPPDLPGGVLVEYQDEAQARQALDEGIISAYYIVPPNYVEKGEIFYVYPETKSLLDDGQDWAMRWTLMVNLLGGDAEAADRAWNPIWDLETTSLAPQPEAGAMGGEDCSRPGFTCETNVLVRYVPSLMSALFFAFFMTSSTMLFNSIGSEKENRTLEVLLLSITPRQLLAGKTLGLSIAGLLQVAAWMGAIFILFSLGGATLSLPEEFTFPTEILVWSLVFFLGGFAVYASLMAGVGALAPKMKEAGAANFIAMLPMMAGYIVGLIAPIAGATNAPLVVGLSLFPLTAPVLMIVRLVDSAVPLWQLLLSVGLTYLAAYFILGGVARLFQAQNLLSGQPFSLRRYWKLAVGEPKFLRVLRGLD